MEIISTGAGNKNLTNTIDARLANFLNIIKINDLPNVTITSLRTTNVIYVASNSECVQFDVNFIIPINFNVDMKITYPRAGRIDERTEIGKLRINVTDEIIKHELLSCTNYLQRQKNVNLAMSILKHCAIAISERKLILDMLVLHSEGFITCENHEEGGVHIKCVNPNTKFKFFESHWKVQFDCVNNLVMDYIDFSITLLDIEFHATVKPIANILIEPHLLYNRKVDLWWKVIYAVSQSVTRDLLLGYSEHSDNKSYLTVRSLQESKPSQYEIPESDEEDCVIIEDD